MNTNQKLNVSVSPHWRNGSTISKLQLIKLTAFLPIIISSYRIYGARSLYLFAATAFFALLFDFIADKFLKGNESQTLDSVVRGLTLACFIPLNAPLWIPLTGSFLMIIIGKRLFGGFGSYPANPAMLALAMLIVSWPQRLDYTIAHLPFDRTSIVEPIRLLKTAGIEAVSKFETMDLFWGIQSAGIGSAMVFGVILGGLWLLITRVVRWQIPVSFIAGIWLTTILLQKAGVSAAGTPTFQLLAGSSLFAAFFLAGDEVTSPVNLVPVIVYGFLGGILLVLMRTFSIFSIAAPFTILLINLTSPLLDRFHPAPLAAKEVDNA